MKSIKKLIYGALFVAGLGLGLTSCNDDDVTYNGDLIGYEAGLPTTFNLAGNNAVDTLSFSCRSLWKLELEKEADAQWLSFSSTSGSGGYVTIIITAKDNNTGIAREANFKIRALEQEKGFSVYQEAADVIVLEPSDVPNYDRFFVNSEHGKNILRSDAKFNFCNYAESEHFFVFWDINYFGNDPGNPELGSNAVNIDDLLEKAEMFFNTNITKLGMADLGQGNSYLDQYKMQIYILDPTPEWWVATGSGYDDTIGALWVTPSTMQPVGSTIGHEIGHSFQYQVYADKLFQGEPADYSTGFRYNPWDGQGNGYWEQCAQWQSYIDYPEEQFTTYNYTEWLNNHHRHFHHEWMRYASYWLQTYWVEKHGIEAFANIWKNSRYPEDAIEAYTRLYNDGDWQKTREELFDYAMKMATFDMESLPAIKKNYVSGQYKENLVKNENGQFQIAYSSCPGSTGFNVIPLAVPSNGGNVTVNFEGLEYGAPLVSTDAGIANVKDVATPVKSYNKASVGSANNMGWRYGFVAYANGVRTYSEVGKDANGSLSFEVPANTEVLYLVVQGSPEEYIGCGWDEDELTDAQFPYAFTLEGVSPEGYEEWDIDFDTPMQDVTVSFNFSVPYTEPNYGMGSFNGVTKEISQAFHLQPSEIISLFAGFGKPAEGKITFQLLQPDGTILYNNSTNANGWWVDQEGYNVGWGSDAYSYIEFEDPSDVGWGMMPKDSYEPGMSGTQTPQLVYTKDGKQYVATWEITITLTE